LNIKVRENRRHLRAPLILKVDYRNVDQFYTTYAENMSIGGMFLCTPSPLAQGTVVFLEFLLPDSTSKIRTKAEVVWTRKRPVSHKKKRGMGVRFMDIAQKDRQKIHDLVTRLRG